MKKQISALLAALLLIPALSACSGGDPAGNADISSAPTDASAASDAPSETELHDNLPRLDYKGASVKIFCTDYGDTLAWDNMYAKEEVGDVVTDAIYQRNRTVSERLNVKLDWTECDFTFGARETMYNTVRSQVMAGDDGMHILCVPSYFISTFIIEGLLLDMNTLPHVEFGQPWWFADYIENATINGKTYMAVGDGSLPYIMGLYALLFNKELAKSYSVGDIYGTVEAGGWTLDALGGIIKDVYKDENGNSTKDKEDLFGLELSGNNFIFPFMESCDVDIITKDAKGNYSFVFGNEHNVAVVKKLCSFIHEGNSVYLDKTDGIALAFSNGRALFAGATLLQTSSHYRTLDFEYGIVPYPKWDEAQEEYHTRASTGTIVFSSPVSCKAVEMTGAVLEAMNFESYKTLTPAYYEVALKIKYSSDDETSRMLDLIKGAITVDFAGLFSSTLGAPIDKFKSAVGSNSSDWSSTVAALEGPVKEKLAALLESVK